MHPLILHNEDIRQAGEKVLSPGQVGLLNGWGVFSTLRVVRGVLFAFEHHFARMQRDAALMHVPFPQEPGWLQDKLLKLVEANRAPNATLRVAVVRNRGGLFEDPEPGRAFDVVAFTKDLTDWGKGVRLYPVPKARYADSRFSGAKITSWSENLTYYEEARERGFDEVILLNERAEVSELTSANIFISQGSFVWTPPLSSGCLRGITRELLLNEVSVRGIEVGEKKLVLRDLEQADEVFITSSTRDLLPVLEVEGLAVQRNGTAGAALSVAFQQYIENYAEKHARARAAD